MGSAAYTVMEASPTEQCKQDRTPHMHIIMEAGTQQRKP